MQSWIVPTVHHLGSGELGAVRHKTLCKLHMLINGIWGQPSHLQLIQSCKQMANSASHQVTSFSTRSTHSSQLHTGMEHQDPSKSPEGRGQSLPRRSTCVTCLFTRGAFLSAVSCDSCQSRRSLHRVTCTISRGLELFSAAGEQQCCNLSAAPLRLALLWRECQQRSGLLQACLAGVLPCPRHLTDLGC